MPGIRWAEMGATVGNEIAEGGWTLRVSVRALDFTPTATKIH